VWDLFEGGHLFRGVDPEHGVYRSRAHLAEMIALLGPPPNELLAASKNRSKFFSDQGSSVYCLHMIVGMDPKIALGEYRAGIEVPSPVTLESLETNLEGEDKLLFLSFMRKMLQWDPKMRHTPKQLLEDEWLQKHTTP
jgi:serine/threonine protein kinase